MNGLCGTGSILVHSASTATGSVTVKGVAVPFRHASITHEGTAGAGNLLLLDGGQEPAEDDACIYVEKQDTSTGDPGGQTANNEDFAKLTFSGVTDDVSSTTNVWHSAGTIGVAYDNWTGTLTYSGSAVAPTYALTPSGGAEVTGPLTAAPGLALGDLVTQPLRASSATSFTRALGVTGFGT